MGGALEEFVHPHNAFHLEVAYGLDAHRCAGEYDRDRLGCVFMRLKGGTNLLLESHFVENLP